MAKITQRKLTGLKRLLMQGGRFNKLMIFLLNNRELSFEVRIDGHAKIYYKKCLALDISPSGKLSINKRYFLDEKGKTISEALFDKIFTDSTKHIETQPENYFCFIKQKIDNWQEVKNTKMEFMVQQEIAANNRSHDSSYFIVDMEYKLSQANIEIREKNINIHDLVAINRENNAVVMFEVKYGLGAVSGGNSGAKDHQDKFNNEFINSNNSEAFKTQLFIDISNIITDKRDLGLIDFDMPTNYIAVEFGIIHVFDNTSREQQEKWYKNNGIENVIFITPPNYTLL